MAVQAIRRTTAALVAAAALMLVTLAVAPTAGAATLYACVKKNGSAHIYAKKPKCRKHETRLAWNTEGLAGQNGLNGTNGANGKNGVNGTNGTNGLKGETGAKGETGPPPTSLWAVVEATGTLARGGTGTVSSGLVEAKHGEYQVEFNRDVTKCAFVATLGLAGTFGLPPAGFVGVVGRAGNNNAVYVETFNAKGETTPEPFHIAAFC